ncbi:MAG: radical SAM protein [Candidatus Diapherotrites archaeon]|nr:radical SAM protein [Candidatus Diapherotrites archaeon]
MKLIIKKAKRAFNRTKIPGARWVINQYIGCQHACKYCYAKFMCRWYDYGEWGSWVVARENIPELAEGKKVEGQVYMSSISDAYQPIEKKLELTRRILEVMDKGTELSILTKSDLVLRDIQLIKEFKDISVGLTVNGFDKEVKKEIEPLSPPIEKRVNTLRSLHEEGIQNYAFISPIIPGLSHIEEIVEKTKGFVDYYWFEFLNLRASGGKFKRWLKEISPESLEILSSQNGMEEQVASIEEIIKREGILAKGVYSHYP